MKTLAAGLQPHLDSGTTTLAWCWRVTRTDGVVFGFTDHDLALTFDGATFEPDSGFVGSAMRYDDKIGVDAQDAQGVLSSGRITESDIAGGLWDGAAVEVWRVNWADTSQRVQMRAGQIGQVRRGKVAFIAEMRSLAHVLAQQGGRTFQGTCDAVLGDARCGLDLELGVYKGAGTVATVLRDRAFTATGLGGAYATDWFSFGTLVWVTGANAGLTVEVARHVLAGATVTITLLGAPGQAIAVNDTFTIRAGCDKAFASCRDKFVNTVNFRGFPNIPGNDAVLRIGKSSKANDGSVL